MESARFRKLAHLLAFVGVLTGARTLADIIHVPNDYPTIQAGIDAASNGDIVEIADGTYTGEGNKDLDFSGKAITVRSASGDPDLCVIDCQGWGQGFYFHSGEGPDSVVDGLKIKDGDAYGGEYGDGGGISCIGSSPTITNCVITGCEAFGGGGICVYDCASIVIDCTITGNSAVDSGGGVSCRDDSTVIFINCGISNNAAGGLETYIPGAGGGVEAGYGATLIDCSITGNDAYGDEWTGGGLGGGIAGQYLTLVNCDISGNTAWGGGSPAEGGGICCGEALTMINCSVSGNSAGHGGGVFFIDGSATCTNCTIADNSAAEGGGIFSFLCDPELTNCVLWGNTPQQIWAEDGTPVVTYCDVQGGWFGTGNINADPLFVDPDSGDYHLGAGSPCIDAADNDAVPADEFDLDEDGDTDEPIPFDLDGNPRFVDDPDTEDTGHGDPPIVDMGAYEFQLEESCPADFDGDGDVDTADLLFLLAAWGTPDGDVDDDGDTDTADLLALLAAWGECP